MGLISDIKIDGSLIGSALEGIGGLAVKIREAITGEISPEKAAEIQKQLLEIEQNARNAQTEINKIEAASSNLFVAGWRPFIGWVCGTAFAYNYVLMPFLVWSVMAFGADVPAMPLLDMGELTTLLFGMLGLGAMRTYEKTKK